MFTAPKMEDFPATMGGRPFSDDELFTFSRRFEIFGETNEAEDDLIALLDINPWIADLLGINAIQAGDPENLKYLAVAKREVMNRACC